MISLNEFQTQIFELAEKKVININNLERTIGRYYVQLIKPAIKFPYEYLIRCNPNDPNEVFTNVSRCSYNPNAAKIGLQRCNYRKQQVFYAAVPHRSEQSTTMTCALLEVLLQSIENPNIEERIVTFSRWKIIKPFNVLAFPFSPNVEKRNPGLYDASKEFERLIKDSMSVQELNNADYVLDSYRFISEYLCKLENKEVVYRITAAFYNAMMKICSYNGNDMDGMLYPSANTQEAGINIVLKKELVNNRTIVPEMLVMYRMKREKDSQKLTSFHPITELAAPDNLGNVKFKFL